eukprot:scaffold3686_cov193-Alexandrium_tamarense.AAC.21
MFAFSSISWYSLQQLQGLISATHQETTVHHVLWPGISSQHNGVLDLSSIQIVPIVKLLLRSSFYTFAWIVCDSNQWLSRRINRTCRNQHYCDLASDGGTNAV